MEPMMAAETDAGASPAPGFLARLLASLGYRELDHFVPLVVSALLLLITALVVKMGGSGSTDTDTLRSAARRLSTDTGARLRRQSSEDAAAARRATREAWLKRQEDAMRTGSEKKRDADEKKGKAAAEPEVEPEPEAPKTPEELAEIARVAARDKKIADMRAELEALEAAAKAEDDDGEGVVDPWKVEGAVDYNKLIDKFGSQRLTPEIVARCVRLAVAIVTCALIRAAWEEVVPVTTMRDARARRMEKLTGRRAHPFIRRGIFFSHR